ncbi:MAG: NIL domain-containing protein [Armatimonadota bacterium]
MTARRVVLHFPPGLIDQPVVSRLVRKYDLDFNILRANITPQEEGLLVLELSGEASKLEEGLTYAQELGVRVQSLEQDVVRLEDVCTHCGACITICPTKALSMDLTSRLVNFEYEKCIACELCVPICPPRAMEARL